MTAKCTSSRTTAQAAEAALKMIRDVTATAEIGKTYLGTVVRIAEFGAFVEIFPGTDGLLHISEIAEARIRAVRDELKEGDQMLVKVLAIEGNKIRLSRKAVLRDQRDKQQKSRSGAGELRDSRFVCNAVLDDQVTREAINRLPFLFAIVSLDDGYPVVPVNALDAGAERSSFHSMRS